MSLKRILITYVLVASGIPLLVSGWWGFHSQNRVMREEIGRRHVLVARALAGEVERFLQRPLSVIDMAAANIDRGLIREHELNRYLETLLDHNPFFNRLALVDLVGRLTHAAPFVPSLILNDMTGREFHAAALSATGPHWSPIFLGPDGNPALTISRVTSAGILVGYLNLSSLGDITDRVTLNPGGRAVVADADGVVIAHPNREPVLERTHLPDLLSGAEAGGILVSVAEVPTNGWRVAVMQSEADAFAPLAAFRRVIPLAGILAVALAIFVALLTLRRVLRPLNELTAAARAITTGHYDRVNLPRSYREVETLAAHFQTMAEAIRAREKAISASEQDYRILFEESPISLWVEDLSRVKTRLDGLIGAGHTDLRAYFRDHQNELAECIASIRVIDVNRQTLTMYEAEDKAGFFQYLGQAIPGEAMFDILDELLDLLARKYTQKETRNYTMKGRVLDVAVKVAIPVSFEETWERAFVSIHDLTERKQAETAREKLERQLLHARKMESLGTLAGGIAHDFNNLLMAMQGNVSLTGLALGPDHPLQEKLWNVEAGIRAASELTRQLLGMARSGKYEVVSLCLNDVIGATIRMFARTRKDVVIHPFLQDGLRPVEADRRQIEQVLLNLYVNAGQAMPDGGALFISSADVELDAEETAPHGVAAGSHVRVSVRDTGTGIAPDIMDRIFDPFFTTREKQRGTGMGLASAYGIIRSHGGFITARNDRGGGAEFLLYLPVTRRAPALPAPEKPAPRERGETILLVDDEAMVIEVTGEMLTALGYRVLNASDGRAAVDLHREQGKEIDLVVLDMIMPGMGGRAVFGEIRAMDPSARVLLSSGYSLDGQAADLMAAGCAGFIQKPFNMKELNDKIREILDRPKGEGS